MSRGRQILGLCAFGMGVLLVCQSTNWLSLEELFGVVLMCMGAVMNLGRP